MTNETAPHGPVSGMDPDEMRRRLAAARELAQARLDRAVALVADIRSEAPPRWAVVAVVGTGLLTLPAGLWQGLAAVFGWPLLPYQASRLAGETAPLLLLGLLALLTRRRRISLLCTTAGAAWATAVKLGWPAPVWTQAATAVLSLAASWVYLVVWRRKLNRWRVELHRLQLLAALPDGHGAAPLATSPPAPRRSD